MFDVLKPIKVYSRVQLFEYEREGVLLVFFNYYIGVLALHYFSFGGKSRAIRIHATDIWLTRIFPTCEFVEIMLAGF